MNRIVLAVLAILVIAGVDYIALRPVDDGPTPAGSREGTEPSSAEERIDGVVYDERGVPVGGLLPNPQGGPPLNIDNIIENSDKGMVVSIDERDTFTVPTPEDHVWEDYLEYRKTYRSSLDTEDRLPFKRIPGDLKVNADRSAFCPIDANLLDEGSIVQAAFDADRTTSGIPDRFPVAIDKVAR